MEITETGLSKWPARAGIPAVQFENLGRAAALFLLHSAFIFSPLEFPMLMPFLLFCTFVLLYYIKIFLDTWGLFSRFLVEYKRQCVKWLIVGDKNYFFFIVFLFQYTSIYWLSSGSIGCIFFFFCICKGRESKSSAITEMNKHWQISLGQTGSIHMIT